jgi:hypothetical protein
MDLVGAHIPRQGANGCDPLPYGDLRIAVLVPCFNEELTIRNVVKDFRDQLPGATVYVYDNNSTDLRPRLVPLAEPSCNKAKVTSSGGCFLISKLMSM